MIEIYFLLRHTPFWAVPLMVMGGEFAYLFWLKKKKRSAIASLLIAFIGLGAVSFYVWAGGPDQSVKIVKKLHRDHVR